MNGRGQHLPGFKRWFKVIPMEVSELFSADFEGQNGQQFWWFLATIAAALLLRFFV